MGARLDMTAFAGMLKEHYTGDKPLNLVYKDRPFLALIPKYKKFGGKYLPVPITYANPAGRSATFSYARANKASSKHQEFLLTRCKDYTFASIDGETMDASESDKDAFIDAFTSEMDGAFNTAANSVSNSLFRNGTGSIGKIGATTNVATTTLTLANADDVVNFEVGQTIVASTADGGGAVKATAAVENKLTVVGIDRVNGVLTMSAAMDSFGAQDWAVADFLFTQGDYGLKMKGLDAWIPVTHPTAGDNFFGVDRSYDTRLSGLRSDGTNKPIEEALIDSLMLGSREGASFSHIFLNPMKWGILEKSLGSKVQYVDIKSEVFIGFTGIYLSTPKGKIPVLADKDCQSNIAWHLQMDTWKLYTLGEAPRLLDRDGNRVLRETDDDGVEMQIGTYGQIGCKGPGFNLRCALA